MLMYGAQFEQESRALLQSIIGNFKSIIQVQAEWLCPLHSYVARFCNFMLHA